MAAGILLYGIALNDSEADWIAFYESHDCRLSDATKAVARRKKLKVKHPAFDCTIVGRPWWWFITIPESCILATGRDATPIERLEVGADWDERLSQFCDLFDLGLRKAGWYITDIEDGEHKGHRIK